MKYLKDVEVCVGQITAVLEVYECTGCGYHMGVDSIYLDQVGDVKGECPSCHKSFKIKWDE